MSPATKMAIAVVKVTAITIYFTLLGEAFIRWFAPVPLTPRYVVDSGYGVRGNWPSISYTHYSVEYGTIKFDVNSAGMRSSREFSEEKPPGIYRIAGLGDSFTMGYDAEESDTFLAQLGKEVSERSGCAVEVLNFGVSGHGTAEELVALNKHVQNYSPDLVVLQWHHSDLSENPRSKLYRTEGGEVQRTETEYLPAVGIRQKLFSSKVYRYIAGNSMAYTWARNRASKATRRAMDAELAENDATPIQASQKTKKRPSLIRQELLAAALLKEFAKIATGPMNADFVILDMPKKLSRTEFESKLPIDTAITEYVYNPISDFEMHTGEMIFREESSGHLTPLGNRIVAKGLASRAADGTHIRGCTPRNSE